ncbi:MAG: myo-inosose-2 dehydratase [Bacillota bacterium]|jgi:inosose dehydratase|nr:myo-inosose-2 dehydratase [Bacillota bacterium]NLJ02399.1 myo-inosose-2 dehydratase [Bacillota bacterium]
MLKKGDVKLGIAPIAWTNDDMPELGGEISFEQCIDEMALAGFEGSEVGNKYPRDPEVLKQALEPRGLEIASAWFSAFLTTKELEETAAEFIKHRDFLHAMGAKVIVVAEQGHSIQGQMDTPLHANKPVFTDEEWERLVDGLHHLGELAHEKGMQIVYHHHMGTGVQTFAEVVRLMESTDPERVSLLLDTGHIAFAGGDPVEMIEKFGPRIKHVHFKDLRAEVEEAVETEQLSFLQAVKRGVFTVPGDGRIDFVPIIEALNEIDYRGWIVVEAEQDPALAPPLEYARKARAYIKEKAGL